MIPAWAWPAAVIADSRAEAMERLPVPKEMLSVPSLETRIQVTYQWTEILENATRWWQNVLNNLQGFMA